IHPCVRRVVEVLVVDDRGGTLLAVTRVALTARRDDDFSEALPMLALVALVPLVAFVALLPVDSRRPLQPYRACIALVALLAVDARPALTAILAPVAYIALRALAPCRARIALVALVTLGARIALQPLEPCRAGGTFRTDWADASAQGEVEGDAVVVRRTPAGRDHQAVGARRAEVRTVDRDVDLEGAPVSG